MSLLTGEPRSASVRARDGAVVYEVGAQQYAPVLRAHPELVETLAKLMVTRLDERRVRLDARAAARERADLARKIRRALKPARS
jgi:CRP-like cAMP-binding protein